MSDMLTSYIVQSHMINGRHVECLLLSVAIHVHMTVKKESSINTVLVTYSDTPYDPTLNSRQGKLLLLCNGFLTDG